MSANRRFFIVALMLFLAASPSVADWILRAPGDILVFGHSHLRQYEEAPVSQSPLSEIGSGPG